MDQLIRAPKITPKETDLAGDMLVAFYRELGWDPNTQIIDVTKVRTTKVVFDELLNAMYVQQPGNDGIAMMMVNSGPGVDSDIPEGMVRLMAGWVKND